MPQFEFWLSSEDFDRLFAIKELQGKNYLTGNEFARELIEKELHRLHPGIPAVNENKEEIV